MSAPHMADFELLLGKRDTPSSRPDPAPESASEPTISELPARRGRSGSFAPGPPFLRAPRTLPGTALGSTAGPDGINSLGQHLAWQCSARRQLADRVEVKGVLEAGVGAGEEGAERGERLDVVRVPLLEDLDE
eukprot:2492778-Rhodomonas_salina.2